MIFKKKYLNQQVVVDPQIKLVSSTSLIMLRLQAR